MPQRFAPLLVRAPESPIPVRHGHAERIIDHDGGLLRVLGGPGTGKTALAVELAVDRILRRHADPENVLVLTANRRAAATVRAAISARLAGSGLRVARGPLVRTVHSYAFGVLRLQAALNGTPPPRLLAAADQDVMIRDLLAGDVKEFAGRSWPERMRPALALPGFAAELRDLLLRAAERGVGPEELAELGRAHHRPEWVAAGRFGTQYEEVTLLRGAVGASSAGGTAPALDAAELVTSALVAFDTDDVLRDREQSRVRHLVVDDAQHLDPQQFQLIVRIGQTANECALFGDPDQAVFAFRGAEAALLADLDPSGDRTIVLHTDHRMAPAIRAAVRRLTDRMPAAGPRRDLHGPPDADPDADTGRVDVRLFASAAQEAGWVADQLRRAHLLDGVPWADMAVLVRSAVRSLPVLRRALLAAGVPLVVPAEALPLAQHPVIRPFLELVAVAAADVPLDEETAAMLLAGPLGGADALSMRRLRRGLRRLELAAGGGRSSSALLVEVIESADALAALEPGAADPVRRIAELLALARKTVDDGIEQVLWQLWSASGLQRRLVNQSARRGPGGAHADRDLDAVVELFETAARYTDRLPGASVRGFFDYLAAQQIVGDTLAPSAPQGEAVALLTAHSSVGREWTVVAIPGVQEGQWPDLRLRGTVLGVEKLVDTLAGFPDDDNLSSVAPILAEERRLFRLAASRARKTLLVSAVRGEDEQPSRFLDELDGTVADPNAVARPVRPPERGLLMADLVGELRRVVCATDTDPARARRAARQLARLAEAGVPGADPDSWYGLPAVSTEEPLWTTEDEVRVSPSTVEVLTRCPLRWFVERHGGSDMVELPAVTGNLVHALAQAASEGASADELRKALDTAWAEVDAGAPWFSRRERLRVQRMLESFLRWLVSSRSELTEVAVERQLDVRPERKPGGPWLRMRGRVDRLEVDAEGRPVIVDIKTGKTPPTKAEALGHPQLAVYQLAVALGAFGELDVSTEPGGARLLYVAKETKRNGVTELAQPPLDKEALAGWLEVVQSAAAACLGPTYQATENAGCDRCPARTACPLHDEGRQVAE
ncbi:MAG TPA: ATP-dependent DNA helicase [Pseudonocardiaceae bacterium]|jgi:superfamily I DNA/RNA helicase/RecB family exonuclease|nr:ATP-dependent DNA helicase [Pseudonocardiaceae bacterium]